ncbi:zinc protease [Fontimonas thermophila]|uniref:Zinc protease n=1 Tax=Fontimonas thermophila TaxID=1076937 RepID=A0A1I2JC21_9GAMM|nr:pitrilysin family protein [Fontimonas thermophila]SFF51383.1 zinc protease [Fontimonas thermophila]
MKNVIAAVTAALLGVLALVPAHGKPSASEFPDVRIPYERHVLPNGLTLLIHEDHKAPIVAVNVWYHVGSKDERPGRTGFAHLFEHLMFNGSEHHNDEFFRPLEPAGATKMNGTTWYDRTNYFQNVPTSALDLTLWLESDRMGHLLGAIDQNKLDEQREVVLNEKRQGENEPYGKVDEVIAAATYPAGHPYSWTTIGSYEDLKAATLDDVKEWFREHYGAANAVLVIAGDVNPAAVKAKVEHYFGDIPPGPVRKRHGRWIAKMSGEKRATLQDRVPQARLFKVWNVPGFCETDANMLGIAAAVLGSGKNSRLYERLVYRDQLATDVDVGVGPFEIGSQFMIDAMVKPGGDIAAVERAIDEELQRFLREGPTAAELARVRTKVFASALRGLERIDGFGGKSAILAQYQVYCGTPDRYTEELREVREATPQQVRDVARRWLSDGVFVLQVEPFPEYTVASTGADRSRLPPLGEPPSLSLPPLQRATLSNGLKLVLVERHAAPIVQLSLIADAGYAADAGIKAGTARLTLDMLDEGAGRYDALALAARSEELGALISAGSTLDTSFVRLNALKARLEPSLDLFADVLLRPRFDARELERLRQQQLAAIQQEKAQPYGIASRLYPQLIYGAGHAYANPRSGTGTEDSVAAITVDDLRAFYQRWLRPDNATLLIVGDTTLEEIRPLLERRLGAWKAPDVPLPQKNLAEVALPRQPRIVLVNRTGAEQSLILAAHLAPPKSDPDDLAMQLVNTALGGNFVSRLNMNLREDKRWSYGAFTVISGAKAQRPFIAYAPVQTDKTVESLREMRTELATVRDGRPLTADEIAFARNSLVRSLPGENETAAEIAESYTTVLVHELPDDYWNTFVDRVEGLSPAAINAAARRLVHPDALTWIVVGDLARIEQPIRELGWGEVMVLDADGKRLR